MRKSLFLVLVTLVLVGCADKSAPAKWSAAEVQSFTATCQSNLSTRIVDPSKAQPICQCWVTALQNEFSPAQAENPDSDTETAMQNKLRTCGDSNGIYNIVRVKHVSALSAARNLTADAPKALATGTAHPEQLPLPKGMSRILGKVKEGEPKSAAHMDKAGLPLAKRFATEISITRNGDERTVYFELHSKDDKNIIVIKLTGTVDKATNKVKFVGDGVELELAGGDEFLHTFEGTLKYEGETVKVKKIRYQTLLGAKEIDHPGEKDPIYSAPLHRKLDEVFANNINKQTPLEIMEIDGKPAFFYASAQQPKDNEKTGKKDTELAAYSGSFGFNERVRFAHVANSDSGLTTKHHGFGHADVSLTDLQHGVSNLKIRFRYETGKDAGFTREFTVSRQAAEELEE